MALRQAVVGDVGQKSPIFPEPWRELLAYCDGATSSKPSKRWIKNVAPLIESVGKDEFFRVMEVVLTATGTPAPFKIVTHRWGPQWAVEIDESLVDETVADRLRGLVWCCLAYPDRAPLVFLGDAAGRCFQKVPGYGPRAPKVGNACVYVLSELPGLDAVSQLSRVAVGVKHASTRNSVNKALDRAAKKAGLSRQDLEEMAVPAYGFTEIGLRREKVGEFHAELSTDGSTVALVFRDDSGKARKSVPVAVKRDFPEDLSRLRREVKELRSLLPSLRARLERMFLTERELTVKTWEERYAHHPLLATLVRRLLWRLQPDPDAEPTIMTFRESGWVDFEGRPVETPPDATLRLWHPLDSPAEAVKAWREQLEESGLIQPFKQAHREIYVLTDAERRTETYSNRFAAHVIRQHLFLNLCRERGWKASYLGQYDADNEVPHRFYAEVGLRAEFWVDPAALDATSDAGVFLYLTTDQVRLSAIDPEGGRPQLLPLEEVPPKAFSEILRDVDLFVAVTSVGNDPNWSDGGPNGIYRDYWVDAAFGELGETAKTRKQALERLVPRLKIADKCRITDRFLEVDGSFRTYRIHLGSSNIQMMPDHQYLCIVQERKPTGAAAKVHLPFEGDSILSLILSKAFLLADDHKIKDRSILHQIQDSRGPV